jgi:hypothetical protein
MEIDFKLHHYPLVPIFCELRWVLPEFLPVGGEYVHRDSIQPRDKRHPLPAKVCDGSERPVKNLSGQVFGFFSRGNAAVYECVHAVKILFVKFREMKSIVLRRLYEETVAVAACQGLQFCLRGSFF